MFTFSEPRNPSSFNADKLKGKSLSERSSTESV